MAHEAFGTRSEKKEAQPPALFRQSSAPIASLDFRTNRLRGDDMKPADYARMAEECSRQADAMRPGTERDALMEKARLYRSYARMDNWVASRELQPPS